MSDPVARLSTALEDRYQVERELGQGGMATVYLARDLKHDRRVALKVMRPELAALIGGERFLNEIRVTANLQHPHILPLHDSGDAGGFLFYVMPYVEGESLREKLQREKQLPVSEAIELTRAVASALDYAHRHGVVHRDIKPENILLHDGQPTVADFGIALAVSQAGGSRLTETGLSVGTPHYMSPEQAMGDRELDARSDVYSVGAMLFEMLAGDPPHTGSTAQAIVAKVITEKAPSLTALRDTVPSHVAAAVARALNKLPADRFTSARAFAEALADPTWVPPTQTLQAGEKPTAGGARTFPPWLIGAAVVGAAVLGLLAGRGMRPESAPPPQVRFALPLEGANGGLALTPDGAILAWVKRTGGEDTLFLRRADALTDVPLHTSANLIAPFFAPDGQRVGFTTVGGGLYWMGVQGTPPVMLTDSGGPGSWGRDGFVYFQHRHELGPAIARIRDTGGEIEHLTSADTTAAHFAPMLLPGGDRVLFTATTGRGGATSSSLIAAAFAAVLDLRSREVRSITRGFGALYAPPGYLVYRTGDGVLFSSPLDLDRMELGEATPIANGIVDWTASESGTLVFQYRGTAAALQGGAGLAIVDRNGSGQDLPVPSKFYRNIALSPNGRYLALEVQEDPARDGGYVGLLELGDSVVARLTFEGLDTYPSWSPDQRHIAFSRFIDGQRDVYWKPVDGRGAEELILAREGVQFEPLFSPDGRWLVYRDGNADNPTSDLGIRIRSLEDGSDTEFIDRPNARERSPTISPDGQWLAYLSDELGPTEVFVRPFPEGATGAVWQVSVDGGTEPMWAHSGRELFYKSGGYMMVAEIQVRPLFSVRARRRLFPIDQYLNNAWHPRYVVLPGDQTLVMITIPQSNVGVNTVVALNHFR